VNGRGTAARAASAPDETILGTHGTRAILHIDMDAFYVSVELRRRPELVGRPVVVGGTDRRGVVAAASYEARRYGVFSAMPSSVARRKCPQAVFLPGDHALYAEVSAQVHEIFHSVTPLVEPLALDEAFLDVTGSLRLFGSARAIADLVRSRVADELNLVCSVGGGTSKFIAKLASKRAKPRITDRGVEPGPGVVLVAPGRELPFLHPLPVQALWGVGPTTLDRLQRFGIATVGDLAELELQTLVGALGQAQGRHLHELAWARDDRPVEPDRAVKSIGHEETFAHDRHTHDELMREAVRLADAVSSRLRATGQGARTITLKLRFNDFVTVNRSHTLPAPVITARAMLDALEPMLRAIELTRGVRLFGVSVSGFGAPAEQLSLDQWFASAAPPSVTASGTSPASGAGSRPVSVEQEWEAASETIDAIRGRFGKRSIGPASSLSTAGLRVIRPGEQQWGPTADPSPVRERGRGRSAGARQRGVAPPRGVVPPAGSDVGQTDGTDVIEP
jgi:DNA polymerase IV